MKRLLLALLTFAPVHLVAEEKGYDPLDLPSSSEVVVRDVEFVDAERSREIPLRVYFGTEVKSAPVVLFSHGLGGSRENNGYLGNHWASRGYVVVAMQHAGSDQAVWEDVPVLQRRAALKSAASGKNSSARNADVRATLDQLDLWNRDEDHFLFGRVDLEKVGMSGHSFGAVTTQAVSGQRFGPAGGRFTDERIDAAVAFSPSPPTLGDPGRAFGAVEIPWLLMTGTKDSSAIARTTPEDRQKVYPSLPEGEKYELVLKDAEHMAFSDRTLRGAEHRNPKHHLSIIALSTAFWDSYLKRDPEAKAWLDGSGPRSVLEEADRWQRK